MLLHEEPMVLEEETIMLQDGQEIHEVEELAWVKVMVLTHLPLNPQYKHRRFTYMHYELSLLFKTLH
jgi:hypothetical protein